MSFLGKAFSDFAMSMAGVNDEDDSSGIENESDKEAVDSGIQNYNPFLSSNNSQNIINRPRRVNRDEPTFEGISLN